MVTRIELLPDDLIYIIYNKLHNNYLKNVNLEYKKKINNIKYNILKSTWGERIKYNSISQIHYLLENIEYFHILKIHDSTGPHLFNNKVI